MKETVKKYAWKLTSGDDLRVGRLRPAWVGGGVDITQEARRAQAARWSGDMQGRSGGPTQLRRIGVG